MCSMTMPHPPTYAPALLSMLQAPTRAASTIRAPLHTAPARQHALHTAPARQRALHTAAARQRALHTTAVRQRGDDTARKERPHNLQPQTTVGSGQPMPYGPAFKPGDGSPAPPRTQASLQSSRLVHVIQKTWRAAQAQTPGEHSQARPSAGLGMGPTHGLPTAWRGDDSARPARWSHRRGRFVLPFGRALNASITTMCAQETFEARKATCKASISCISNAALHFVLNDNVLLVSACDVPTTRTHRDVTQPDRPILT